MARRGLLSTQLILQIIAKQATEKETFCPQRGTNARVWGERIRAAEVVANFYGPETGPKKRCWDATDRVAWGSC